MSIAHGTTLNICSIFRLLAEPCVLCGSMSHHGVWCEACDAALPYLAGSHCPVCTKPTPNGEVCGHCLKNPPAFSHTIAVFAYSFPIDRLIQAMKYDEQIFLARMMAKKLAPLIDRSNLPDC